MKFYFLLILSLFFTSCQSTFFYQVYQASYSEEIVYKDDRLVYEDENCRVLYNLWSDGGNIGFQLFNKTDSNLYLNLEESFFILNGIAYNYFKNRIYTTSTSSGITSSRGGNISNSITGLNQFDQIQTNKISLTTSLGNVSTSGISFSYNEEKIVCIPSKTSKIISEYSINESLFRDCDLLKFPTKKEVVTKTFTKEKSPFVFSNKIAYSIGKNGSLLRFSNDFFVSEITNYPENEVLESKYDEFCGQKSLYMTYFFKNTSANRFYLKYNRAQYESWIH